MTYILNIETATTVCSVSLAKNGKEIFCKEIDNGFTHAENLHVFIHDSLKQTNIKANELSAVAVSKGPGSYTGLRIGVSAAKGLAYALNIPLISLDTLQIMANQALNTEAQRHKDTEKTSQNLRAAVSKYYCPMIDARRMEVYHAVYNHELKQQTETEALIVDENSGQKFSDYSEIYFFGDGMSKCKELLSTLKNANFIDNIKPSTKFMCDLSFKKFNEKTFEDVAYFEPFYLKDFLIKKKAK